MCTHWGISIATMSNKTMISRVVDGVIVVSHNTQAPSASDWNEFCVLAGSAPRGGVVLVPPSCPGPNAGQRKLVTEAWSKNPDAHVSIITTTRVHRIIITAMAYFAGSQFSAYDPSDWQKALANAAPRPAWPELLRILEQDLRELGGLNECVRAGVDPAQWSRSLQLGASNSVAM